MKWKLNHYGGMALLAFLAAKRFFLVVQPFHPTTIQSTTATRRAAFFVPKRATSSMLFTTRSTTSSKEEEASSSSSSSKRRPPERWTTETVRSTFIDYFITAPRNHVFQPSSSCAPLADPTLLFTNAGMNQFKPIFLGQVDPNSNMSQLRRAVNSQKCIRAGGKHNDLEDVGRDTYHHTFFEMLGTWSFNGDYFKKEAIDYAWELLTKVYQLDANRLYATYFAGDAAAGLEPDTEARDYWLQYLPPHHVIGCSAKDNFWEMGETGPCGPCSEIHYDRIGGGRDASSMVNADDPDVLEIWNIVFIQYNRETAATGSDSSGGGLKSLPAQHIDTGMGLERLVSVLQNKMSNYDIDCFQPLFDKIATLTDKGPYTGRVGQDDVDLKDTAYRAIADHARTLTFAIADGAVPNNEGRGYVLRRVLRRATRYGQQILNCPPGFFTQLVPIVVETFGAAFPELKEQEATIIEIVQEEEQAFSTMLDRGIQFFTSLQEQLQEQQQQQEGSRIQVPGDQAFYLYDTLGFPIDLTQLMAEEAGMTVDIQGFNEAMQAQKDRSRRAQRAARSRASGGADLELVAEQTAWLQNQGIHPTDDGFKYKWNVDLPATVMAIYIDDGDDTNAGFLSSSTDNDDASRSCIQQGDFVGLVLDKSSFYAEAGGQVADTGIIEILDDDGRIAGSMTVTDVQVYAGFILHKGVVDMINDTEVGTIVNCKVDYERRRLIAPNHSMTHVLNAALRQVLGDAVDQRGSLCNEEKLRFDFSHKKALNLQELKRVEEICQATVQNAEVVTSQVMPLKDATAIDGVRAVFGEVYPDPVRVISIGKDTSIEFCGGTHLDNTAESEAFCIVEETAVAKGIRRITAVTKSAAEAAIATGEQFKSQVLEAEKLNADETPDLEKQAGSIRKDLDAALMSALVKAELRARIEDIQKRASDANRKALQQRVDMVLKDVKKHIQTAVDAGVKMLVLNVDIGADAKASQSVMNTVKSMAPDLAFFAISEEEPGSGGKLMAFAVVPDALELKANDWVNASLQVCGGRGGGKAGSAQGQAKECKDVDAVLEAARVFAESKVQVETI
jgi:alanyl-tRNA synthetase